MAWDVTSADIFSMNAAYRLLSTVPLKKCVAETKKRGAVGNWPDLFQTLMLMCGKVSHKDFVELTAAPLFPITF